MDKIKTIIILLSICGVSYSQIPDTLINERPAVADTILATQSIPIIVEVPDSGYIKIKYRAKANNTSNKVVLKQINSDFTAPIIDSAEIGIYNDTIIALYASENLDTNSIPETTDFSVSEGTASVAVSGVDIVDDNIYVALERSVSLDSTIVISYSGTAARDLTNAYHKNLLASFSDTSVTNNLSPGSTGLLTGLISLWELDESSGAIADAHGSALIPTDSISGVTYGVAGVVGTGTCLTFSGNNSFVRPNDVGGALQRDTLSVSFWFKEGTANDYYIRYMGANAGWSMASSSGGIVSFYMRTPNYAFAQTDANICDDTWHHVVGTYNGSIVRIYVNGVLQAYTETDNINTSYTGARFEWGTNNLANDFSGEMDQIAIWNRALSLEEIQILYNSGNGLEYTNF